MAGLRAALLILILVCLGAPASAESAPRLRLVQSGIDPDLFVWTDTCNVYVVRDREAALLIDLGDGSVLDHLSEIGVSKVEWVLFTHHHREQCQGAPRLRGTGAKLAGPEAERELFEKPAEFRKMKVRLGDKYTIHGSSYVRPPIQPIPLDRAFGTNDTFTWRGREFLCLDTRGNSPGGMTYLLKGAQAWVAFSGDLMLEGAKMHTWFDTEWDYGFAAGIKALRQSVARFGNYRFGLMCPSHGELVTSPIEELTAFATRLERLEPLYLRGYDPEGGSVAYQDKVSKPTVITNLWQVTPHIFKFKRPNFWPNFGLILSDSGRGLAVDCGLLDEKFLDDALEGMRQHYGLKAIDAVLITHMHGDHFLEAPHLRERWGAKIWALANMLDKMEHPERFDYAAPIQAYAKKNPDGSPMEGVHVDRAFKPGETFKWEGYRFTVDWMPGQTEFALCLHGRIDGRNVAFTGDNIFGDPDDPKQNGHEAMVAHNSAILEEGYIYGSDYLKRLKPDLLIGGHSFVMDHPAAFIERYRKWSYAMRDAYRALSSESDYRYWFDPFWVRSEPCRLTLRAGESRTVALHVRNFHSRKQTHRIEIHTPKGLIVEPKVLEGSLRQSAQGVFPLRVTAARELAGGVHLVGLDVTVDGKRYGERFDWSVEVLGD